MSPAWINVLTFIPLAGGILVMSLPEEQKRLSRALAVSISIVCLCLAIGMWAGFGSLVGAFPMEQRVDWIPSLGVQYHVGLDGLGLLMVLLTALLVPLAMFASWNLQERVPLYFGLVLCLQTGLFGTFTALNFFHWFIYWELSLVPAFFLIKFWGGPFRSEAATQFFVYTMVGSIAMLLSFLAIFLVTNKFDFTDLAEMGRSGALANALSNQLGWRDLTANWLVRVIFAGVFLGLAVKVPLVPLHTWLPAAYAEAPTGTTMLLTGVMSKMGVYGFLRILLPLFPREMHALATPLLWLSVFSIVFSAGAAFAQRDLKRMLAYSSINHLGYCLLGVFAVTASSNAVAPGIERVAALNGVMLQMFNHGLTAAALFWFVGLLEQRGRGLRSVNDFGGLRKVAPVFCGLMGIALFSSLGLPGLNGFVGEFLIFKGVFPLASWAAGVAVLGLLITAIFILTLLQRVFNGPLNERWRALPDLNLQERLLAGFAIGLMLLLGIYPQLLVGVVNGTVTRLVQTLSF